MKSNIILHDHHDDDRGCTFGLLPSKHRIGAKNNICEIFYLNCKIFKSFCLYLALARDTTVPLSPGHRMTRGTESAMGQGSWSFANSKQSSLGASLHLF